MNEWNTGEPPREGWYDCILNGVEMPLQWWVCKINAKKRHWKDEHGAYREVEGEVRWTGEARATMW